VLDITVIPHGGKELAMKTFWRMILVVLLVGMTATAAFGDSAAISETGACDIWGPTSYVISEGGVFKAAINKNLVNATCKWTVEDFDLGQADVRTYSGEGYNVCTIWFGRYPDEIKYTGSGQSTISASGQVTVKCQAATDTCVSNGGTCPP
jgi:hypothetical protein